MGSVLNLMVAKRRTWLEVLQEAANSWRWQGQAISCVELVPDDMHRNLLAGASVPILETAFDEETQQHHRYGPSSAQCLLFNIEWLSKVLDEKAVEEIGKVWRASSAGKVEEGNPRRNRLYSCWFVFEFSGRAYQVLEAARSS